MRKKFTDFRFEFIMIILFLIMSITACSWNFINFDEFFTMQWCRSSRSDFLYEVLHDTAPFLYYFMIRPFVILTGHNILMARLFSLSAVFILFLLGTTFVKKEFGRKAMFFYLSILYLNPFMLQKSTEIRMYIWASAFTLLSGMYCYRLLSAPSRKDWIRFTLFALLASCTHYYAVLTMIFPYLGLLFYFACTRNKKELKNWFICAGVTVVSYLPFLLIAIFQIRESSGNWISAPSSRLAPLKELFYSPVRGTEYLYLSIMAFSTLLALIFFLREKKVEYYWSLICCSSLWGIAAFCILFGQLVKPVLLSRYLIMSICLLFLGLAPLARRTSRYILLLLCLCFALVSSLQYRGALTTLKEDKTEDTLRFAKEQIREGDSILLISGDDYLYNCTSYFVPQARLHYAGAFETGQFPENAGDSGFWFFDNGEHLNQAELAKAGMQAEDFGQYQLGYIHMRIYKISFIPVPQKSASTP